MKEKITRSSGNVFSDLGFPSEEAEYHLGLSLESNSVRWAAAVGREGGAKPPRSRPPLHGTIARGGMRLTEKMGP